MLKKLILLFILLFFLASFAAVGAALYAYQYFTRDLPTFASIEDYQPPAVTQVYSEGGTLVGEFFKEKRYPVVLDQVPVHVRNAFLAAEDSAFYTHPGIDLFSIVRAAVKNLQTGSVKQGASTITQQVIKNLLLSREKKYERKIKEAILAYRLEERLSKDQILELYLNQIYFGNGAYGIRAAAEIYYKQQVGDLTIAQAAMLAGLPKAPSRYSPVKSFKLAKKRQRYVISQMRKAGFITDDEAKDAIQEEIKVFDHDVKTIYRAPYYVSEVRRRFEERWPDLDLDLDGYQIHTALDLDAYVFAQEAIRQNLRDVDKRIGWRGPLKNYENVSLNEFRSLFNAEEPELMTNTVYPAYVLARSAASGKVTVDVAGKEFVLDSKSLGWARRFVDQDDRVRWIKPLEQINKGDVIEVSFSGPSSGQAKPGVLLPVALGEKFVVKLDQTPEIESALVLLDPHTGKVPAIIGGYDYKHSQFNRATQGLRQPGSAFKPIVYLTAIDSFGFTPATTVYDEPRAFKVGDDYWTPANYDKNFLGPITLRTALQKSRNLISADIISRIGVDSVIQYARKLGITTKLGRNLSLSLGSSEVTPLEITRAYGVFAAKGVLFDSVFITRVIDRHGNKIYDAEDEALIRAKEVISEASAFVMAYMMKGVVQYGTGWKVKELGRPVAGKTGTSNDQMDAWFVGYTPEWACGIWTGFDKKKTIGSKETGGKVSAPAWLNFMASFLEKQDKEKLGELNKELIEDAERLGIEFTEPEKVEPLDFGVPDGVEPYWIDKTTGRMAIAGEDGSFLEYFLDGTQPEEAEDYNEKVDYWDDPLL